MLLYKEKFKTSIQKDILNLGFKADFVTNAGRIVASSKLGTHEPFGNWLEISFIFLSTKPCTKESLLKSSSIKESLRNTSLFRWAYS